ncbi:hypothetical protein B0H19DRAFT_1141680 [Mycena capillaripes]|nr:hypothetical protein B0H19DRAFT_1141680 [Mycena capillaripes]
MSIIWMILILHLHPLSLTLSKTKSPSPSRRHHRFQSAGVGAFSTVGTGLFVAFSSSATMSPKLCSPIIMAARCQLSARRSRTSTRNQTMMLKRIERSWTSLPINSTRHWSSCSTISTT